METIIQPPKQQTAQHQNKQPGLESEMDPKPVYDSDEPGYGRLNGKVAIITGGDSGIGRAVAVHFAKEGADVAIVYLDEHDDARETQSLVQNYGKQALLIPCDISVEENCKEAVEKTLDHFGHIDILVNNAGMQFEQHNIEDISAEQLERTFRVNIFAQFYMSRFVAPHLSDGSTIINTASITAFRGNEVLMDYASTKGAIVAFTRSLSQSLIKRNIRVNAVAPGPVWTPLIPASFPAEKVKEFGKDIPMGRAAQPAEIAPCYVFLASKESSFISGQVLHPNGGVVLNT
jgi:NAD(P)-dependent dehydrogenase (short-subunit alcohol dehydrogenase family)